MAEFKESLQNQVAAQVKPGKQCEPPFNKALRKEAVEKAAFAQICGVTDAEYDSVGDPYVFDSKISEVVKF